MAFEVKDSGARKEFGSGMVRDTAEGKIDYHRTLDGPLFERWAEHLTKGAQKYPDNEDGTPNWTLANGQAELHRFRKSALRHFLQWFRGKVDEDHASAVIFNMNGAEYVKLRMKVEEAPAEYVSAPLPNKVPTVTGGGVCGDPSHAHMVRCNLPYPHPERPHQNTKLAPGMVWGSNGVMVSLANHTKPCRTCKKPAAEFQCLDHDRGTFTFNMSVNNSYTPHTCGRE